GLLRPVQNASTLPKEIAFAQDGDRDQAGRLLDHDPAPAALDEEDGVAGLALEKDHLAGVDLEPAQSTGECTQRSVWKAVKDRRALERAQSRGQVVEGRRRAVRPPLRRGIAAIVGR